MSEDKRMNEADQRLTRLETLVDLGFKQLNDSLTTLTNSTNELLKNSKDVEVLRAEHDGLVDRVNTNDVHIHNITESIGNINKDVSENSQRIAGLYNSNDELVWLKRTVLGLMFTTIMGLIGYIWMENHKKSDNPELMQLIKTQTGLLQEMVGKKDAGNP